MPSAVVTVISYQLERTKRRSGPTCFSRAITKPPITAAQSELVLIAARRKVEETREAEAIFRSFFHAHELRLPWWVCDLTRDVDWRQRTRTGEGEGHRVQLLPRWQHRRHCDSAGGGY